MRYSSNWRVGLIGSGKCNFFSGYLYGSMATSISSLFCCDSAHLSFYQFHRENSNANVYGQLAFNIFISW